MQIEIDVLLAYGATAKKYKKGEIIINEGSYPRYYFQILSGTVKMYSLNEDGKEMIQGIFNEGESFGEPPIFTKQPYPSNAIVDSESIIYRLSTEKLYFLLDFYPKITLDLLTTFAHRIYQKASKVQILNYHTPEQKILGFFNFLKSESPIENSKFLINYTRQQIADSTGLRVETVIRTILKLNIEKKLEINKHKVYY